MNLTNIVVDALSFTHFSAEIGRDCENQSPGTFQTFSFGTDVSQMSEVHFAGKKWKVVESSYDRGGVVWLHEKRGPKVCQTT